MLVRKKRMIVMLVLSLFIIDLCLVSSSSADLTTPQTTVGDYWNYSGSYLGTTATFTATIAERTNITVENEVYDVFVSVDTIDGTGPQNTSLHRTQSAFYRVSDGAIVKITDDFNYSSDSLNQTFTYEYVYSPPLNMFSYPIDVGKKWEKEYALKTIDLLTTNISEQQTNESYECERTTTEQSMGQDFACYVVKKTEVTNNGRVSTWYYLSPVVGSEPVRMDIELNGQIIISLRLTSYNVAHPGEAETKGTPGFELTIVAIAIAFAVLLRRKNTNSF
jgi:hypothetical protein